MDSGSDDFDDDKDVKNFIQLDNCAYGRFATQKNAHKFGPKTESSKLSPIARAFNALELQTIDEQRTVFAIGLW